MIMRNANAKQTCIAALGDDSYILLVTDFYNSSNFTGHRGPDKQDAFTKIQSAFVVDIRLQNGGIIAPSLIPDNGLDPFNRLGARRRWPPLFNIQKTGYELIL
jgi:hypothetical protein